MVADLIEKSTFDRTIDYINGVVIPLEQYRVMKSSYKYDLAVASATGDKEKVNDALINIAHVNYKKKEAEYLEFRLSIVNSIFDEPVLITLKEIFLSAKGSEDAFNKELDTIKKR